MLRFGGLHFFAGMPLATVTVFPLVAAQFLAAPLGILSALVLGAEITAGKFFRTQGDNPSNFMDLEHGVRSNWAAGSSDTQYCNFCNGVFEQNVGEIFQFTIFV